MIARNERELLEDVAESYRARGYKVQIGAGVDAGDAGFDIVAQKDADHRIVEVRYAGRPNNGRAGSAAIEDWLSRHPGWHFDLVIAGGAHVTTVELPRHADLADRIARAQRLVDEGQLDAGLLLGWAAFEAAARARLVALGREVPADVGPSVLRAAAREGIVDPDEADRLRHAMAIHNAVAHGGPREGDGRGDQGPLAVRCAGRCVVAW